MGILLIGLKSLIHLMEGFFIKKYTQKHGDGGAVFVSIVTFISMIVFVLTDKGGFSFPREILLYGILSSICYASASVFTYVALESGSFVLTMLIISYSTVFSVVYGIVFLKEVTTLFTWLGIILIFVSLFFINSEKKEENEKKIITPRWVFAVLVSFVGNGVFGVLARMQQIRFNDAYSNEYMIVALGISATALLIYGLYKERGAVGKIFNRGLIYAVLAGASNGATNLLGFAVTMIVPISIVGPMNSGIKNLFAFLFSVLLFRERLNKNRVIGVALGTVSLILFNI